MNTATTETAPGELTADAVALYRHGGHLGTEEAVRLAGVLMRLRYRDDMWSRMLKRHNAAHVRLLTDTAKAAGRGSKAPALSLLAFVLWQGGKPALARRAARLALRDIPGYSMAELLLHGALDWNAPPSLAKLPMTTAQVARSYDEMGVPR
jgi:Domain of unknown function (DUF4192)